MNAQKKFYEKKISEQRLCEINGTEFFWEEKT